MAILLLVQPQKPKKGKRANFPVPNKAEAQRLNNLANICKSKFKFMSLSSFYVALIPLKFITSKDIYCVQCPNTHNYMKKIVKGAKQQCKRCHKDLYI